MRHATTTSHAVRAPQALASLSSCARPSRCASLAATLLALLAAGCQSTAEPGPLGTHGIPTPPVLAEAPAQCTAARVRFGLGRRVSGPMLQEMRARSGARTVRIEPQTDYDAIPAPDTSRLTVDIDARGRMMAARCG